MLCHSIFYMQEKEIQEKKLQEKEEVLKFNFCIKLKVKTKIKNNSSGINILKS